MYTPADGGKSVELNVFDLKKPGVAMAMYNADEVRFVCGDFGLEGKGRY